MDTPATTALATRWTLESSLRRNSPIWPPDTDQTCGCERALRRGAGRSWLCIHQSPYSAHPGRRVVILEPWYAAHFRTHTLGDRLPNSFGVLFSLGYNHVMASLLGWRVRILLLAEFQKGQSMRWILAPFGAVIENKQTLPAGGKFIDDSHPSRWRQIAETLVEERSILISSACGT